MQWFTFSTSKLILGKNRNRFKFKVISFYQNKIKIIFFNRNITYNLIKSSKLNKSSKELSDVNYNGMAEH